MTTATSTKPKKTGVTPLAAALFVIFFPLAFSDDLIAGAEVGIERARPLRDGLLICLDIVFLAMAAVLALVAERVGKAWRVRWRWYLGAAIAVLVLDVVTTFPPGYRDLASVAAIDLLAAPFYILVLTVMTAAIVGSNRLLRRRARISAAASKDVRRLRFAAPLLVGTLFAYYGSAAFELTGKIDQQYFAQVSQVIPLLLIAIGLDAKHFEVQSKVAVGRAATVLTIATLCIAEALALSVLPAGNGEPSSTLSSWHQYIAFVFTIEACFIALVMLLWTLIPKQPLGV